MPDNVKVLIAERNGTELVYQEELNLIPENIPFSEAGYTADNVQDAILETASVGGVSRGSIICGHNSTSSNGRWMEFHYGVDSDDAPMVVSEPAELVSLSISNKNDANGATFTVFKNGSSVATITIDNTDGSIKRQSKILSTAISFAVNDTISVQQTSSPSTVDVFVLLNLKYLA